jgi:hypothetical protein
MEATNEIKQSNSRGDPCKERPWLWIEKAGRRMIRDVRKKFDSTLSVPAALLIYDGLCEIASDEQSSIFEASLDHIADIAGVSVATIKRLLPVLEQLKLIAIERSYQGNTYLKAPSRYTLLAIAHGEPSIAQSPNKASVSLSRRTGEKSQKKETKNTQSTIFSANGLTPEQKQIVARYNETFVPLGWWSVDKITPAVRKCLANCTREQFDSLAATVANDRASWPGKHSFTALLRHVENAAKPRLTAMRSKELQLLRSKLIDERNRGNLSREEKDAKREQLLEIKKLLKGRGIVYAASL